jgi:hypothetical protein
MRVHTVHRVNIIPCGILRHLEFKQVAKNSLTLCNSELHPISRPNTDDSQTDCFKEVHKFRFSP